MCIKKDHRGCSSRAERAVHDCNLRTVRRSSLYSDHCGYFGFFSLHLPKHPICACAGMRVGSCTPGGGGDRSCVLWEATGIMDVMTQHQDSSEPHNSHHDGWRQSGRWPNSLSVPNPPTPPPFLFFITRTQTENAQKSTLISRSTDQATFQEKNPPIRSCKYDNTVFFI